MMLRCSNLACKAEFEVDETQIDENLKYIQCPFCLVNQENPFYEESE